MLKAGLIGYGSIGKEIESLISKGKAGHVKLLTVLTRSEQHETSSDSLITTKPETFFEQDLDIVIEAAGHKALHTYGAKVLSSGADLLILSTGALADIELYDSLHQTAKEHACKIYIPSGAIAGLDRIAAGSLGMIDEVKLITSKPVKSWYGTIAEKQVDLETITEPHCLFEGSAREAAGLFPESVNAAATLSISGIGVEHTKVLVYIDPTIHSNVHKIIAVGDFGKLEVSIENHPSKINPKSSPVVAMSVAKVLRNLTQEIVVGV
ncbi:aspartate dehydrogenase [Siminovitchia sediminis]|uniref:L-aspartate dehydrogenase n=1 Tax=Siminovitchia sediminis TaxID=1274353 RepID=A0ABW4KE28_9BACI